jgi:hypothetical protein
MKRVLKTRGGFKSATTLRKVAAFSRRILKSDPVQAELKKTRRGMSAESILDKLSLGDLQGLAVKAVPALIKHVGKSVGSPSSRHRGGSLVQDGAYGGIKSSSSIYKLHNKRKSQLQDQQYMYYSDRNFRLASPLNQQSIAEASLLLGGWTGTALPGVSSYPVATLNNFINNIYQPTTTASAQGAIPGISQFKIDMKHIKVKTMVSNAGTAACIVDLYECIPKHDTFYSTSGGGSQISNQGTCSPGNCWYIGLTDQSYKSTTGAGQGLPTILDQVPTASLMFNTYHSVHKRTTIELPAGAVHVHNSY